MGRLQIESERQTAGSTAFVVECRSSSCGPRAVAPAFRFAAYRPAIFVSLGGFRHAVWRISVRLSARRFREMIIDCAHYQDGRRRDEGAVPLQEAAARCGQGGFVWLGLFEPGEEELAQVRDTFGLAQLEGED